MRSTARHSVQYAAVSGEAPDRWNPRKANGQSAFGAAFTLVKCNWGIGMSESPCTVHISVPPLSQTAETLLGARPFSLIAVHLPQWLCRTCWIKPGRSAGLSCSFYQWL